MKKLLAYTPEPFDNSEAEFGEMGEGELGRRSRRPVRGRMRGTPLRKPRPRGQRGYYALRFPTIPLWQPYEDDDSSGDACILWVQDCLNRVLELQLPLDGIANRETRSALREFQRRHGLPVSGVVEVETEAELIVQSIGSLMEAEEDLFIGKAARRISRAASRAAKTVSRAARDVSKVAAQGVKFAGKAYKTASSLTQPIGPKLLTRFGKDVLSGKNVVKSFRSTVKSGLDDVRSRIKYVQMAASFVPGIGTGVSAALGAANALASGRPITDALIEGARRAIPGGPLVQAAFDMGVNLARGQNISTVALNAAKNRIPPAARAAFDTAVALGRGQSLQQAALGTIRNRLPAGGRAVFDTALAVSRGQNLQQSVLANAGRIIPKSPYANRALAAARYADAQSRRFRKFEGEAEQAHSPFCLCPSCCGNEAEELAFESGESGRISYPVLLIDWKKYPNLADNIWQAQKAGYPKVLTYNGPNLLVAKENRKQAMQHIHLGTAYTIPRILSRDEYPFACTKEGGSGWVGHIPPKENSAQGGLVAAFLRQKGIVGGKGEQSKFAVKVINHPKEKK